MHASYYSRTVHFGVEFETKVASELSEFISRLTGSLNEIWHAYRDDRIVGSITIDGEDFGDGVAHLRWFIVDDNQRGAGVGQGLLEQALAFCDKRAFRETHLWTFDGLNAARRLYEQSGFILTESYRGAQWGREVTEQKFVRRANAADSK